MKIWIFRIILLIITCAFSLLFVEVFFWIRGIDVPEATQTQYVGIDQAIKWVRIPNFPPHPADQARIPQFFTYRYLPNSAFSTQFPDNPRGYYDTYNRITYRMNSSGYRGKSYPPKNDKLRIAVIGDSYTLGIGVKANHTFAHRLEQLLGSDDHEVINLGVHGHGLHDHVALLNEHLNTYVPDVVVLGYFLDDLCRPLWLRYSGKILKRREKFRLATPFRSVRYLYHRIGEYFIQKDYIQFVCGAYEYPELWNSFVRMAETFVEELRKRDIHMIFCIFPDMGAVTEKKYTFLTVHHKVQMLFKKHRIDSIDFTPIFGAMKSVDLSTHPSDKHPNEIAHEVIADRLFEALKHYESSRMRNN